MTKIKKNNEAGFTLIEMLIVIIIISTLLLIAVPNMNTSTNVVNDKTCAVTIKLLQSQVAAYEVETGTLPTTLQELVAAEYIDSASCPGGETLTLVDGKVQILSSVQTEPTS